MKATIGLSEAKARLSEVIDRVGRGETFVVSRNGEPVAEIRPIRSVSPAETVERIRAISARVAKRTKNMERWPADGQTIRELAHERHRF